MERIEQVNKINDLFSNNEYPTILAGDFNDTPESEPIKILSSIWKTTFNKFNSANTFSSKHPERKIDYIMLQPSNRWEVIEREVVCDSIASDHCAYWVKLKLFN